MSNDAIPATFTAATEQFLAASDWIGPEHAPAVAAMRLLAAQLDLELTAALAAQYGLTYRALLKAQPADPDANDPLEQALRDAGQG
jgi:hypothetical protein